MSEKTEDFKTRLKNDFRLFLHAIWKYLNLPPPTDVQIDIASFMQHGPRRLGVEAFRGVGKSYIASAFSIWNWYRDSDIRIMVVSASKDRADAFAQFTKRLLHEIPFLNHLIPRQHQRNSMLIFDVGGSKSDQSPSMKSVGITGQLTGSRADLIISDDVEVLNNSSTQVAREKLQELINLVLYSGNWISKPV